MAQYLLGPSPDALWPGDRDHGRTGTVRRLPFVLAGASSGQSCCGMEEFANVCAPRLVEPSNENRSVPIRPANAELRTREYLTPKEVEKLIKTARDGRYGHRDAT